MHVQFAKGALVVLEEAVDFRIADLCAALDHALLQTLHNHFVVHAAAELLERLALAFHGAAQTSDIEFVLRCNLGNGLVHVGVRHLHARTVGAGDLQLGHDQAFQHLLLKHIARR